MSRISSTDIRLPARDPAAVAAGGVGGRVSVSVRVSAACNSARIGLWLVASRRAEAGSRCSCRQAGRQTDRQKLVKDSGVCMRVYIILWPAVSRDAEAGSRCS